MTNKLLAFLILAASPLFAAHIETTDQLLKKDNYITHYGYFYSTRQQEILGVDDNGNSDCVIWTRALALQTDEVFLDCANPCDIILEDQGIYSVTYIVTARNNNENTNFKFALLLNGQVILGSIYGASTTFNGDDDVEELFGQVIFEVTRENSVLELVNNGNDNVVLVSNSGGNGNTVTASITVEKINKL